MKKESKEIDFDFGFSFIDEEIESIKEDNKKLGEEAGTAKDLEERIERLYDSILPFLDNLCKNPEKSTIYWPNRVDKIQEYKKKLKSIAEGTDI